MSLILHPTKAAKQAAIAVCMYVLWTLAVMGDAFNSVATQYGLGQVAGISAGDLLMFATAGLIFAACRIVCRALDMALDEPKDPEDLVSVMVVVSLVMGAIVFALSLGLY